MKKLLAPLVLLMTLAFGSLGQAQSDGFGIYSGYPTWLGVQTQTNNLRLGVGLGYYGIAGSADVILGESALDTGSSDLKMSWYYGAGLNAAIGFSGFGYGGGFYLAPHGLAGIEFGLPGMDSLSFYAEAQLGLIILPYFGPDFGGRAGVIFR